MFWLQNKLQHITKNIQREEKEEIKVFNNKIQKITFKLYFQIHPRAIGKREAFRYKLSLLKTTGSHCKKTHLFYLIALWELRIYVKITYISFLCPLPDYQYIACSFIAIFFISYSQHFGCHKSTR